MLTLPSPILELQHALYPSKVLRTKERASTPCFFVVFSLRLTFESFKELGVHQEVRPMVLSHVNSHVKVKYSLGNISKFQLGSNNVLMGLMLNVLQLNISKWLKSHEF